MIGKGEKMIAVLPIPAGNHLWLVIAIAPETMGMQITTPPAYLGTLQGEGLNDEAKAESSEECIHGHGKSSVSSVSSVMVAYGVTP